MPPTFKKEYFIYIFFVFCALLFALENKNLEQKISSLREYQQNLSWKLENFEKRFWRVMLNSVDARTKNKQNSEKDWFSLKKLWKLWRPPMGDLVLQSSSVISFQDPDLSRITSIPRFRLGMNVGIQLNVSAQ